VRLTAQAEPALNGTAWKADGEELIFVHVGVTDKQGTAVPTANDNLTFTVSGAARFEAACNGDATSLQSFKQPEMQLFNGELVVILRTTEQAGTATLVVKDKQGKLKPVTITVETR
jgi:beta-galactosidase